MILSLGRSCPDQQAVRRSGFRIRTVDTTKFILRSIDGLIFIETRNGEYAGEEQG